MRGLLSADGSVFDPDLPWQRARSVALRPEPFGALLYSFGTRKLSFLKSKALADVVEALADHPTAAAALTAQGVPAAQRPAYLRALADLARSQMIEPRTSLPPTPRRLGAARRSEADHTEADHTEADHTEADHTEEHP